ncbi:MAG TPA: hypothetical protein VGY58_19670 [Gemmataceae bacterium]|jgi:hypothetical protein|nr:hypothetical protein [Gemmataceae bacterium]
MAHEDHWEDCRRIEAWAGEVRVNLIRLAAIIAFYGNHLVQVFVLKDDKAIDSRFHIAVTGVSVAWAIEVLVLHICLSRRYVPDWLKYASTIWDIVMVTSLLVIAGTPRSPLSVLYFLVIATAPLRLSLRLVYVATLGSMAAFVLFLGYYKYFVVGTQRYAEDMERLTRTNQVLFLLALGAAGLLAGQMVRQARRLTEGYPIAVDESREG